MRQYVDWRRFRHDDVRTPSIRRAIGHLCEKIVEALREPWASPGERRKQRETGAQQRADEETRPAGTAAAAKNPTGSGLEPLGINSALAIGPLTLRAARPGGDADRPNFAVFSDAPLAPELVVIPAGKFMMGSTEEEEGGREGERPRHRVTIAQRFAIGRYPVTFDEYDRFCQAMGCNKPEDQGWGRGRQPAINVSRQDAQEYIAWLSQETGRAYRLPSEAEWEYACRAGTTTRYSFGDAITPKDANYDNSGLRRTSEVGAYPPDRWNVHDMHGNVWEWVEDDWHKNYLGAPSGGSVWKDARGPAKSAPLCFARRLLGQRPWELPVRLPPQARRRLPEHQCRVPGGPNTLLILEFRPL